MTMSAPHSRATSNGRRVHITCAGLTLLGALGMLLSSRGSILEGLSGFGLVGVLWSWGWYSGPWRTFTKAGRAGWLSVLPFYNGVVFLQIARHSAWKMPLWLIPGVHLMLGIQVLHTLSKDLGRGPLLPVILFLGAATPFYVASAAWLPIGLYEYQASGSYNAVLAMGIKAFFAGIHVSVLVGCLPLGLGHTEAPADTCG